MDKIEIIRRRVFGLDKNPEDVKGYKLCYIDQSMNHSSVVYFSQSEPGDVWGDDWNDAPFEHNAGIPYEEFAPFVTFVAFDLILPNTEFVNSYYSVEDLNQKKFPWVREEIYQEDKKLYAGASVKEFIELMDELEIVYF